jgi:C-terminal processing protease CtpA/Prc
VTRMYEESPAARVGMKSGDLLVTVDGRQVRQMKEGELQSIFNAPAMKGHDISVKHEDGSMATFSLKEGAVYPLFREIGALE